MRFGAVGPSACAAAAISSTVVPHCRLGAVTAGRRAGGRACGGAGGRCRLGAGAARRARGDQGGRQEHRYDQ